MPEVAGSSGATGNEGERASRSELASSREAASPTASGRGVLRAARTVAGWTFLSRILGLVRDRLSAAAFGVGQVWDAFAVAWTFPNTFRRLLGEGALASAFIPTLTEVRAAEGEDGAAKLINGVFTLLVLTLVGLTVVSLVALLLIPPDVFEWCADPEKVALTTRLLQVLTPYLVLICVTAFLGAILQTLGHFGAPAAAPLLLNVSWIVGLVVVAPAFGSNPNQQIYAVALAILVGGLLQVLICVPPLARRGVRVRFTRDFRHPAIRRLLVRMFPIVVGLAPTQINILADRIIAELMVGDGANATLYYGTRLMQFPLALIGVAMATAVLPELAGHASRRDDPALRGTLRGALTVTLFVAVPAAVGLIVLASPIVRFLFETGRFGPEDTVATAAVVFGYTAGIPAICLLQVVTRAFYARGDTRTPVRIAMLAMVANLVLNLLLVGPLGAAGLAWATSIAAVLNLGASCLALQGKIGGFLGGAFARSAVTTVLLAALMGGGCVLVSNGLEGIRPDSAGMLHDAVGALGPVLTGVVVYGLSARLARVRELDEILGALRRRRSGSQDGAE